MMVEATCNNSSADPSNDLEDPTAKAEECSNSLSTSSVPTHSASNEDVESRTPHLELDQQYTAEADTDGTCCHAGDPYASADTYRMYAQIAAQNSSHDTHHNRRTLVYRVDHRPYIPSWRVESITNHNSTAGTELLLHSIQCVAAAILLLQVASDQAPEPATIRHVTQFLSVERVMGGVTNTLYKVSGFQHPNQTGTFSVDTVLVRLFGAEGLIDRDEETGVFAALSLVQLAPMYYGRFANGRVEGYQQGTRPLHYTELSGSNNQSITRGIANRLARLHYGFRILPLLPPERRQPTLWKQLYDWLDQAEMALPSLPLNEEILAELQLSKVRHELSWLQEEVQRILGSQENEAIVFCHNDLLAANILFDDTTETIELIDFEYGGINYRAFDIANHFNEYAGGPPTDAIPNYDLLPNESQQRLFIRTYLETAAATTSVTTSSAVPSHNAATNIEAVSEAQVDAMLREVRIFGLANHLYWGLWAINQAATEGCAIYDYMTYAVCRIRMYWSTKPVAPHVES